MAAFRWWYCPCLSCCYMYLCSVPSSGWIKSRCIDTLHFVIQLIDIWVLGGLSWIILLCRYLDGHILDFFFFWGLFVWECSTGPKINQCLTFRNRRPPPRWWHPVIFTIWEFRLPHIFHTPTSFIHHPGFYHSPDSQQCWRSSHVLIGCLWIFLVSCPL